MRFVTTACALARMCEHDRNVGICQRPRQSILGQLPRIYRADGSPIRVLLVDDEPALTNLVKMALHYEGWVVDIVCDGREAIGEFESVGSDVLVAGVML